MASTLDNILSGAKSKQLLAIKQLQRTLDVTQKQLATGRKVSSALDNPQNFFTSLSLSNQASDLLRLLDGINQGVKAVQQADNGITAAQKIIDQAEALLHEALIDLFTGEGRPFPNIIPSNESDFIPYSFQDGTGTVTLNENNREITINGNAWKRLDINNVTIDQNTILRFEYSSTQTPEISTIGFDNDNSYLNNTNRFFINGTQTVGLNHSAPVNTFQYDGSGDTVTYEIPVGEYFTGTFQYLTLINDNDANPAEGDASFKNIALYNPENPIDTLVPAKNIEKTPQYEEDFSLLLDQLDKLTSDSHYRGINLLTGGELDVIFNETQTSKINIKGRNITAGGLGLTKHNFQSYNKLINSIDKIKDAKKTLRQFASALNNNLNITKTRQTFIKESINTLKAGSDQLTLADLNETGANFLALQTRQQVQFSILSAPSASIANFL